MNKQPPNQAADTALASDLEAAVEACMPEVIRMRRHLHQHPELSGREIQTSEQIARVCNGLGLEVRTHIGGHGVLAALHAGASLPWVALRADMDALPIREAREGSYRSEHAEISHACGHDAHSAMLLGAAQVLSRMKEHLGSNVAFVFQPAEET
ncbi:MAG: M20/M25/M40 family metallo-hydrolase [Mariprofundaceae bacterium]